MKCVKKHQQECDDLRVLLKNSSQMDTLVLHKSRHESPVLDILSKFELRDYIHSLIEPAESEFKFYLPRYKLTFRLLPGGVLKCNEIAGYQLLSQQQTDDTLRGVSRYLLLEKSTGIGPDLIIFPAGEVERKSLGVVDINISKDCDAELIWYQYEFHPRFKYLETKQVCFV